MSVEMMSSHPEIGRFKLLDTTGRDGDQSQPYENQFPKGTKLIWAEESARMGIDTIEAGFPATPADTEEVEEVARTIGRTEYRVTPYHIDNDNNELVQDETYVHTPVITGLARANMSDIEKTWGAIQDARHRSIGIHTFIATSPEHIEVKFPQKTPDDIVDMAREAVRYAREVSEGNAVVEFSAEVATGTPLDFLERVVKTALDEGANVINLPDTKGEASPKMIRKMFKAATSWMIYGGYERDVTISTHCHNDFGFATANTTSAVQAVIETSEEMGVPAPDVQAEVVWGGRGERAGNSSAEQVVMAMQKFAGEYEGLQLPKLDITRIAKLTQVVFSLLNMEIPANAPIIGKDVRTHRSGIHADAIVKGGARIYAPYDPQWVGHPESAIIAPGGYQGTRGNNNLGPWHKY